MEKIKTFLVDDEAMALEVLENMLARYNDIEIVGSYTRPMDALKGLENIEPDLIFLDIEMGDMSGLELAELFIGELDNVEIVFVTAYSQYAVDAFEVNAIDYLLKPIQESRLSKSIKRVKENREKDSIEENGEDILDNKLKVYSFNGFQVLDKKGEPFSWRTQKSKELFAYLWKRKDKEASKDLIIENVFPDRDLEKATTLIHTTIYQLRKNLKELGYPTGIIYENESYKLNIPMKSDLDELENIINLKTYSDESIREILKIYKGDFLEEGYHWAMDRQEHYRSIVLKILEDYGKQSLEKEKTSLFLKICLDKAYEIDPFNEKIAEMMIHYYGREKNRARLEDFFNNYEDKLWEEMELKPMKNTRETYKQYMEII